VSIPTAGDHPDADVLADLAAEVLPAPQAEELEAHVRTCSQCAGLLGEAERVRRVLRAADPGPIPADVAARLDAAVAAEWARQAPDAAEWARQAPDAADTGEADPWPPRRVPDRPPGSGRPLSRPARSTQRTRRQVREEERDDARPGRSRRWLALAAGVIVVAGLGGLVAREVGGGPTSGAESAGSAGSAGGTAAAPASTPILATGTDYGPDTLDAQVKALLAKSRVVALTQPKAADQSAVPSGASPAPLRSAGAPAGGQSLRDPAALQGCLDAIDAEGVRPVAVDLATYQGREAAILVLPGRDGGYEVWAVARSCRPGADGTLHFAAVRA
jgi:hypothetical protein